MFRKITFLSIILALTLSACAAPITPTPAISEVEPTAAAPESTEVPPTEFPEPTPEPEPTVMAITDDFGNSFELSEYPQAIVSLSASTTEILFAIGAGDQVVGRDEYSLYPEEALEVANVGALWGELPTETILALEPDLVVAAQIISAEQVQTLIDLGLNVYYQDNPLDYGGLYDNLRDMAALTGHQSEAEALIEVLEERVNDVLGKVAPLSYHPSVFYELDATDPSSPWTTGAGTFIDYIIAMAGGMNAASSVEGDFAQISAEELIAVNPEIILLADALYGITPESVAERPGWDVIAAVQNGALYPIDPNMMSVPGPRLVDALEETAKLLHPELFE
jgi:iron complex transport system substrate-binding protein